MNKEWLEGRKADIEKAFNDATDEIAKLETKRSELRGAFSIVTEAITKLEEVEIIPPKVAKGAKNGRK